MFILSCVCYMPVRLFISVLWSLAGKGFPFWLSFMVLIPDICTLTYFLGVDVLQNGVSGPTDLLLNKEVLKGHDKEGPIIQVGIQNWVKKSLQLTIF